MLWNTTDFKNDGKGRIAAAPITAAIPDIDYRTSINVLATHRLQISFTKGDVLVCQVRVTQTQTGGGLKTEYAVIKVEEHIRSPQQMDLLIEEPKGDQPS